MTRKENTKRMKALMEEMKKAPKKEISSPEPKTFKSKKKTFSNKGD